MKPPRNRAGALARGRAFLRRRAWLSAYRQLSEADRQALLGSRDLEALAASAHLSGHTEASLRLLSRLHRNYLEAGETERAARFAFWLGFIALNAGDAAQANGWLARAGRLLEGRKACVEQGYLLIPPGICLAREGRTEEAQALFVRAREIGKRFRDVDLVTMALNGQGRALIRGGEHAQGTRLLDEAMIAVIAGEVSPIVSGGMYCSVLESCRETYDVRRAREWTEALERWCSAQPELVPFRGHCVLHRAEILQLRGAWPEALAECDSARERLAAPPPQPALGSAHYRIAELHRLQGAYARAEEAYRRASHAGCASGPGPALLQLAQGRIEEARRAIDRLVAEARGGAGRAELLDAAVEIALAANDLATAKARAGKLEKIARRHKAPLLEAMCACAAGALHLAGKEPRKALPALRRGWEAWTQIGAPYPAARARVLIACALGESGDREAAALELAAARPVFERLGALPDLARLDALARPGPAAGCSPLTSREIEVLKLVAAGAGNRGIAAKLGISQKTVARHLSNMFVKIGVSSRSAATAYAFRQRLV